MAFEDGVCPEFCAFSYSQRQPRVESMQSSFAKLLFGMIRAYDR